MTQMKRRAERQGEEGKGQRREDGKQKFICG
jgi:hypothetical protein